MSVFCSTALAFFIDEPSPGKDTDEDAGDDDRIQSEARDKKLIFPYREIFSVLLFFFRIFIAAFKKTMAVSYWGAEWEKEPLPGSIVRVEKWSNGSWGFSALWLRIGLSDESEPWRAFPMLIAFCVKVHEIWIYMAAQLLRRFILNANWTLKTEINYKR